MGNFGKNKYFSIYSCVFLFILQYFSTETKLKNCSEKNARHHLPSWTTCFLRELLRRTDDRHSYRYRVETLGAFDLTAQCEIVTIYRYVCSRHYTGCSAHGLPKGNGGQTTSSSIHPTPLAWSYPLPLINIIFFVKSDEIPKNDPLNHSKKLSMNFCPTVLVLI